MSMREASSRRFSRTFSMTRELGAVSREPALLPQPSLAPPLAPFAPGEAPRGLERSGGRAGRDGTPQGLGSSEYDGRAQQERSENRDDRVVRERAEGDDSADRERSAEDDPHRHEGEQVSDRRFREGVQAEERLRQRILDEARRRSGQDRTAESSRTGDDRGRNEKPVDGPGSPVLRAAEEELESRR